MGYPTTPSSTSRSRAATGLSNRELLRNAVSNSVEGWIRDTLRSTRYVPGEGRSLGEAVEHVMRQTFGSSEPALAGPRSGSNFQRWRSGDTAAAKAIRDAAPKGYGEYALAEMAKPSSELASMDAKNYATAFAGFKKFARSNILSWAEEMAIKLASELLSTWIALGEERAVVPPGTTQGPCYAKGDFQGAAAAGQGCGAVIDPAGAPSYIGWDHTPGNPWWWENLKVSVSAINSNFWRTEVVGHWDNDSPTMPAPITWSPGNVPRGDNDNDDWRMPIDPAMQPVVSGKPDPFPRATPYPLIPYRVPNPWRSPVEQDHRPKPVPPRRLPAPVKPPSFVHPPLPGEKEVKFNPKQALVIKRLISVTEVNDFVDCLYDALPKYRKKEKDWSLTKTSEKYKLVYKYWREIDWEKAAANLITNHIEDMVIGKLEGTRQDILTEHALGVKTPHGDLQRNPLTPSYQKKVSEFIDTYVAPRVRDVVHAWWNTPAI